MNAKMSRSEKIVAGLAVAVLVAGFASGVLAKPTGMSRHGSSPVTHVMPSQAQPNVQTSSRPKVSLMVETCQIS
ncbi:hypothetical protein SAMN05444161_5410 [Rhizobiales bacterium GAS191]|jgi:hypothetical protein|nr:hypothetical protein SAMN05519103_04647 [Rhizobiales bacterium GAS113]SEE26034.1 hypothetical protein SAMN05519104_5612 [Rhizobiales bacterium GAS188]SEE31663.1 hypothetical protein SAMN05444161_5410 [Rhizobiales bacterium GAS191]